MDERVVLELVADWFGTRNLRKSGTTTSEIRGKPSLKRLGRKIPNHNVRNVERQKIPTHNKRHKRKRTPWRIRKKKRKGQGRKDQITTGCRVARQSQQTTTKVY